MSGRLPVAVLLGRDIPEFDQLLGSMDARSAPTDEALVVVMSAQARNELEAEREKELLAGGSPTPVEYEQRQGTHLTKERKRQLRQQCQEGETGEQEPNKHSLESSAEELRALKDNDQTLSKRPLRDTLAQQVLVSSGEGNCCIGDGHPLGEEKRVRWSSLCYLRSVGALYWLWVTRFRWQGTWGRRRHDRGSCRDSTGPHCTRTWRTIAAVVSFARSQRVVQYRLCHLWIFPLSANRFQSGHRYCWTTTKEQVREQV